MVDNVLFMSNTVLMQSYPERLLWHKQTPNSQNTLGRLYVKACMQTADMQ